MGHNVVLYVTETEMSFSFHLKLPMLFCPINTLKTTELHFTTELKLGAERISMKMNPVSYVYQLTNR